jgi:hypothetical protein
MTGNTPNFTDPLPSMSNDSTTGTNTLISQITQGMHVVDVNNDDIGKVAIVAMGDPDAATIDTTDTGEEFGLITPVARALGTDDEPDVENQSLRERLLRAGYIKIDGKGWFGSDLYAGSAQIASVSGDTVRLNTTKDELVKE